MTKLAEPSTPSDSVENSTTKATDHALQKYDNFTRYGHGRENGASMGRRLLTGPKGPCVIVVVIPGDGPERPEQEAQQLEHRRSSTDVSHRCLPEFSTGFPHLIHRVANWSLLFWNFSLLVQAVGKAN